MNVEVANMLIENGKLNKHDLHAWVINEVAEVFCVRLFEHCKDFRDNNTINAIVIEAVKLEYLTLLSVIKESGVPLDTTSHKIIGYYEYKHKYEELVKDSEMYKSFYDHYHGWPQL